MTRGCDGPFGAVRPLDAPSWLIAEPRTTARIRWPLRCASDSRSTTRVAMPSDHPVPSASAENALHLPSGASARCFEASTKIDGVVITADAPANARSLSPERSDWIAQCSATNEDEHAVSTV